MKLEDLPSIPLASLPSGDIVYFARCFGLVKIGQTKDGPKRLRVLQTQNAAPLDIVAWGVGTTIRERALHEIFEEHRHHGEWFRPDEAILAVMADALANSAKWHETEAARDRKCAEGYAEMMREIEARKSDLWTDNASRGLLD